VNLDRRFRLAVRLVPVILALSGLTVHAQQGAPSATYYVDCESGAMGSDGSLGRPLQSVGAVNALTLRAGDRVLMKRGTLCRGALRPKGSGGDGLPIRLGAYGEGDLPRIEAGATDEAALELHDQEFWEISQLDLKGGLVYGVFVESQTKILRHVYLVDLRVHDVRGKLTRKASGLVVIKARGSQPKAGFENVQIDGVMAYRTTQWAGIFVSNATHVRISNSVVHDVQGDGIVIFTARDALIAQSVAWHTGMEPQETIGTPNAIWTWACVDCVVRNNEAFLTDSPGVDGGAFDIDFANTRNTVQGNFGHDTAGYCVSVFGAFGPTVHSVVADNLCLNNGMSARLAQRQGALLLMTWQGGTIDGLDIRGNRVGWQPPGRTPLLQIGADLSANDVTLTHNEFESTGASFVNAGLKYTGTQNTCVVVGTPTLPKEDGTVIRGCSLLGARKSTLLTQESKRGFQAATGWTLNIDIPADIRKKDLDDFRAILIASESAQLQFGPAGLRVVLTAGEKELTVARDLDLTEGNLVLRRAIIPHHEHLRVRLTSSSGKIIREWKKYPNPADIGYTLWRNLGHPTFSHLGFADTPAVP
jgi:hypothetical protein